MSVSTQSSFAAGKAVGRWTLLRPVDPDLSAPLWLAHDGELAAYVRAYKLKSARVLERLDQVLGWAKRYESDRILRVIEPIAVDGGALAGVASRFEEGQTLATVLARATLARKTVPAPVAVAIALDLLAALEDVGGRLAPGWARGAVRPECVIVTRSGRARLMEVGAASLLGAVEPLAQEPRWIAWASPEELESSKPGERSDLYSVAALTWAMIAGKAPFAGRTAQELRQQIQSGAEPLADAGALGIALMKALSVAASDRQETARALADALRTCAEVAEPFEVSQLLERDHRSVLDERRRLLEQALGKALPLSIPPAPRSEPAARSASVRPPASVPPGARTPSLPPLSSGRTPSVAPPSLRPSVSSGQPSVRPAPPSIPRAEPSRPDSLRPSSIPRPASSAPAAPAPPPESQPGEADDDLDWSGESAGVVAKSEPSAASAAAEEAPVAEEAPPPASEPSAPASVGDAPPPAEAPPEAPPAAPEAPAVAAPAPPPPPPPAPAMVAPARIAPASVELDDPLLAPRKRVHWPSLLGGAAAGALVALVLGAVAGSSAAPPSEPEASAAPPPPPLCEPCATALPAAPETDASAAASAEPVKKKKKKRGAAKAPPEGEPARAPKAKATAVAPPPPPAAPPPADVYE